MRINERVRQEACDYVNWVEKALCAEYHGATYPECLDDHDRGYELLAELGGEPQ